jgi:hypothetical protein
MTGIQQMLVSGIAPKSPYLYDIITQLALTTSLTTVLDAADSRSTDGSSQTWTDIKGTANWQRGSTAGSDANDPTFNGVANDGKDTTYWSFDGGDYFQNSTSTYQDPWVKASGAFTQVYLLFPKAGTQVLNNFSDGSGFSNRLVFYLQSGSLNLLHPTSNVGSQTLTGALNVTTSAWNFIAVTWNEATPAAKFYIQTSNETPAGASGSTRTNNLSTGSPASWIGTDGVSFFPNLTRLGCCAFWSRELSSGELSSIYTKLKARRFTTLP